MPASLTFQQQQLPISTVKRADPVKTAVPQVNFEKIEQWADLDKQLYQAPQNARIGNYGEIVPEQLGYKLDHKFFSEQFFSYFMGSGPSIIQAPRVTIYPKVDSELLSLIKEKAIGHYVTYFNASNKNRAHNIALSAKAINNYVVFPGEIFSFNQVVGMRTKEKGYQQAPIIVSGELSEGIGGGICQVSSTLFNAIDRAGLRIVQRYSHSRNVPYVLPGRDATVSWGGPDFSFQNQYNQPVLIRMYAGGGRMFVTIYSSDIIEYKPREVPSMSERLPKEISIETDVKNPAHP
ncbi:VanW family protein [Paenibacillus eucommiae]|nr:VanW family protein [Paenibacillus eucommiae]